MSAKERDFAILPWVFGGLFVAGIVHIASVLIMPRLALKDGYALLSGVGQGVTILPDPGDKQSIPFQDPAATLATCRFDLDNGPTRVRYAAGETLVTLSFHDRTGRIFYSTTDRAALHGRVDILLLDTQQLDTLEANDPEDLTPQELRLVPPTRAGYVLVRSIAERPSAKAAAVKAAQAVACGPER